MGTMTIPKALTEEQIQERVNGWIEKFTRWVQHEIQEGLRGQNRGRQMVDHIRSCKEWWTEELRKNSMFLPRPRKDMMEHEPMEFLSWEEE